MVPVTPVLRGRQWKLKERSGTVLMLLSNSFRKTPEVLWMQLK